MDLNFLFRKGKLTTIMDASAGSSGKGKLGSFVTEHATNWQFCCNTFGPQAGHWVKLDDGRKFFYQTLNSCAYNVNRYEKMYLGHGCILELPAFFREIEENNVPMKKIGISPIAAILQDIDAQFERGEVDLDGNRLKEVGLGTMKSGSTCHGVGACKARKILRRPNIKLARDIPELKEFLCDVPGEIMNRLDDGQAGLMEVAQGFQLSYGLDGMYPFCTSRNCTVAAGLDDMMLPTKYAGAVILNCRTYPIRINNRKFIAQDGHHMTWAEVEQYRKESKPFEIKEFNSGHGYDDQVEVEWEEVTRLSGSPEPIIEMTSVTKLPRRVFTFSKRNLLQAIKYNDCGSDIFVSINFVNYVDHALSGKRSESDITEKMQQWMNVHLWDVCEATGAKILCLGTGAPTDDMIVTL